MAEAKKGNSKQAWYTQCLNWCWSHRWAVAGIVAALVAMWLWRFWLLNYESNSGWQIDSWYKHFIEQSMWLNIILFIFTLFVTIIWGYYVCWFKQRWYHIFLYALGISVLWIVPALKPVNTPIHIHYHVWATILIGGVAIAEMWVLVSGLFKNKASIKGQGGFIAHVDIDRHQPTGWSAFVESLLGMVGSSQLQQDSFTIGITGSWGSGKTTFYKLVREKLKEDEKFGVCEFQPWQVVNYAQLSSQYFETFKQYLIDQGVLAESDLISHISKYSGVLESIPEVSSFAKPIINAIHAHEDSTLQTLHDNIGNILAEKNLLTAVMIDDLDRLNQNELMEVLRLIRVSANFRNVLFIVTYDKDHISKVMGGNGKEYLKKIVNVEISLPPIENYKYRNLLMENVSRIVPNLSQTQLQELDMAFRTTVKSHGTTLLNRYSHNFRDLIRFSNHFGLVLTHLQSLNLLPEYNLFDLFWLEMLRYFDEDTYYQLQEHPLCLLEKTANSGTKQEYLRLSDLSQKNIKSKDILEVLFDANRANYGNTIIWINNYNNYFAHRFLDNAVSMTEFSYLMGGCIRSSYLRTQVSNWHKGYQRMSLEQVIMNYPHNNMFHSKTAILNYVRVLFLLYKLNAFNFEKLKELFRAKSRSSFFMRLQKEELKLLLRRTIAQHPGCEWNYLLTAMCIVWTQEMEDWEDYSRFENEFILNHNELIQLAELNYITYFKGEQMSLPELFNSDSKHFQFISSLSYVNKVYVDDKNNKTNQYSNLIGNFIVNQFEKKYTLKGKQEDFKYIYDNLIKVSGVQGMEDESMAVYMIQETIEQTLGSLKNFEKIINRHFELNSIYKQRCQGLGLKIN